MRKIWYRKSESAWYLTVRENGRQKQIRLLMAPNDKEGKKRAEQKALEELTSRADDRGSPAPSWALVEDVITAFLRHSYATHEPATYAWYKFILDTVPPSVGRLRITQLGKKHVVAWMQGRGYNPTSQNKAIGAIKRAFQWAVEEEYIRQSPIAHVRKPTARVRERILTPEDRQLILASIKGQAFRDFVHAMTLTG